MRTLVTGATGFIGGNLVRELLQQGHQVKALVRQGSDRNNINHLDVDVVVGDLMDKVSLKDALAGCDVLFHVAAAYTFWTPDPTVIYQTNVKGTENILAAARSAGVGKIVYTSTESTIGIDEHLGSEEMETTIEHLSGHYKKSKLLAERHALDMCKKGLPLTIVNPTMPVGPWDVKPTPSGQIIVDFLNGRMPAYVNTGLNVVAVEDVAKGHILAMEKGDIGERYILGNRNLTFRELLGLLEEITGIRAPGVRIPIWLALGAAYVDEFISGKIMKVHPRIPVSAVRTADKFRYFDCSKAIRQLDFPQTPIEESLTSAVSWFRHNGYVG